MNRIAQTISEIKTIEQAREAIKNAGMTPVPIQPYIFYQCGHIIAACDDPLRTVNKGKRQKVRICPICAGEFLTRYKICKCGTEQMSKWVSQGFCKPCAKLNAVAKSAEFKKTYFPGASKKKSEIRKQAAEKRIDCMHRRGCIDKHIDSKKEALPCVECKKYFPVCFNADARSGRGRILESVF
jgi:hypothetical protein